MREDVVLCAANAYHQKYYLNPEYGNLPEQKQNEQNQNAKQKHHQKQPK